ncbi:class A beta-lactamase-related serine hydrolase [Arthrobacter sp. FW306-05-C]|uniref:serine hydrolase n=1 Tax=Arthrobacter TaxID=1663 RepID=UPI001EF0D706|nr:MULTISPECIES: serine hydrolase [Arthrobacter]MDP9988893.1 beta-lactamase class A [Arthrobacter oryzae]UKA67642.1 class A beta-lactamase-related serine hydrolase [Arthrobacter sp. FW306-05-C]UKA72117.1 class A beta-lactamase-related serine hydrolase [Arthrobacter sp. FW306-06-A]
MSEHPLVPTPGRDAPPPAPRKPGPGKPGSSKAQGNRRLLILALIVVLVIVGTITLAVVRSEPRSGAVLPTPPAVPAAPVAAAPPSLQDSVDNILSEADEYRIGLALADVSGGAERTFGDQSTFTAASTAKILTAAAFYHLVEEGQASLDAPMGDYDAAFQLKAMVNDSNNDSWLLLMDAVGYPQLIAYADSIGVTYDPEQNLLTAADMALILKKLYAGELLDKDNTDQLLSYMQDTNDEDLIPAGSRAGVDVHHKYGEVSGELHDAALLSYGGSTFALVIYTENPDGVADEDQAEVIRDLTRAVEDALFPVGLAGK